LNARNFRYLFENAKDGILQSGCIWDSGYEKVTNYLYMAQMQRKSETKRMKVRIAKDELEQDLNFFILGSYTFPYVEKMLDIIKKNNVITVILPYIPPIQRLVLCHWHELSEGAGIEFAEFMENPYLYLKEAGIKNIYFLYENGKDLTGNLNYIKEGHYFGKVEKDIAHTINNLEGTEIPVYKAGYIVENQWIFYFGQYGRKLSAYPQFIYDWEKYGAKHIPFKKDHELFDKVKEICYEYVKLFGTTIPTTIVMYQGPINDNHRDVDSVLTAKVFREDQGCKPEILSDGSNCLIKCMHHNDYALLKKHKERSRTESCFGVLLLGNVNLNYFLTEITQRFQCVNNKIRAVGMPSCGRIEFWNRKFPAVLEQGDIKYWVCTLHQKTDSTAIFNLLVNNAYNRVITVTEEYGYCFSGYLVPLVEERD